MYLGRRSVYLTIVDGWRRGMMISSRGLKNG
jgi:hypothetical protein